MSGTDLTMFDPKANMPAHIGAFFGSEEGSNIDDRLKVNSLSPRASSGRSRSTATRPR